MPGETHNLRQSHLMQAVLAIRTQGGPGHDPNGENPINCVYISPNGSRCAIGHLLSEGEARRLERLGHGAVDAFEPEDLPEFIRDDLDFYDELQMAHDLSLRRAPNAFLEEFESAARIVASHYGLEYPA